MVQEAKSTVTGEGKELDTSAPFISAEATPRACEEALEKIFPAYARPKSRDAIQKNVGVQQLNQGVSLYLNDSNAQSELGKAYTFGAIAMMAPKDALSENTPYKLMFKDMDGLRATINACAKQKGIVREPGMEIG